MSPGLSHPDEIYGFRLRGRWEEVYQVVEVGALVLAVAPGVTKGVTVWFAEMWVLVLGVALVPQAL